MSRLGRGAHWPLHGLNEGMLRGQWKLHDDQLCPLRTGLELKKVLRASPDDRKPLQGLTPMHKTATRHDIEPAPMGCLAPRVWQAAVGRQAHCPGRQPQGIGLDQSLYERSC